jgi:hypothetical protein
MLLSESVGSEVHNKYLTKYFRNYFPGIGGMSGDDGLPYSTLSYSNGPGYKHPEEGGARYDISRDDMSKYIHSIGLNVLFYSTFIYRK